MMREIIAQEPDESSTSSFFPRACFKKAASASAKPSLRAAFGFFGNESYLTMYSCKFSFKKSAHPDPPCPSKHPKYEQ